jgi:hypothetical protein
MPTPASYPDLFGSGYAGLGFRTIPHLSSTAAITGAIEGRGGRIAVSLACTKVIVLPDYCGPQTQTVGSTLFKLQILHLVNRRGHEFQLHLSSGSCVVRREDQGRAFKRHDHRRTPFILTDGGRRRGFSGFCVRWHAADVGGHSKGKALPILAGIRRLEANRLKGGGIRPGGRS